MPDDCPCVICRSATRPRFDKHGWTIRACAACGHEQVGDGVLDTSHTEGVYGDAYFTVGGDGYADYLAEADLLREHGRRYGRLLNNRMPAGRVLDVGAAAGFVLAGLVDEGWHGTGVEPNDTMARHGREQLGLDVRTGDLETANTKTADLETADTETTGIGTTDNDGAFDLVTMIQVVPHLRDVRSAFANAQRLTKPGGCWLIETWDRASLPARVLGWHWHEYSPPSVLHWFSKAGVVELASQFGMRPVASGRPAKRIAAGHAKSLLSAKAAQSWVAQSLIAKPASFAASLLPDRLALPYPALDLFWLLLEKRGDTTG